LPHLFIKLKPHNICWGFGVWGYVGKQFKIVTRNKLEIQAIKQALTDLEQLKKEDLVIEEEMSRIENDADASVL